MAGATAKQQIERFGAVTGKNDFVRQLAFCQRSHGQFDVAGIVLDEQDWTKVRQMDSPAVWRGKANVKVAP